MPITETFSGFIETTTDALLVFEACRRGKLPKISRRLQDRERGSIQSGTVFVFDEKESGIKRWTDGLVWSPSRILGNFLIYRELDGRESLYHKAPFEYDSPYLPIPVQQQHYQQHQQFSAQDDIEPLLGELSSEERNRERNLVGSLTDTYKFRKGGLIKKTISIHLNGSTQHMISYYTRSDVLDGKLATPSSISDLSNLQISPELLLKQSFRVPPSVEFAELMLKRPSLSPSSTNSTASITTASTMRRKFSHASITTHHSLYEIRHQARVNEDDQPLPLDHSRRLSFESIGNSKKYARMTMDDQHESIRRRSSLFLPLNSNTNESRAPLPLSVNTDKMLSFPPLPPPPRPHYIHQHHEGKDVTAPNLPISDIYTRSATAMNSSPSNSRLSFDTTDLFYDNRVTEKQRYQSSVSNDMSNRALFKQDAQDAYPSPFRLQKNYGSNSPSYERNNGPSLPSPSSLIWSSTNSAPNSSANVHQSQQQDYNDGNRSMEYNRLSPPPLSQTTEASPLSFEPTSMYSSPTSTYYHRYEKQQENSESNHNKYYSSAASTSFAATSASSAAAASAAAVSSSSSPSSSTMFNSRNSIHYQLFSSGNNI